MCKREYSVSNREPFYQGLNHIVPNLNVYSVTDPDESEFDATDMIPLYLFVICVILTAANFMILIWLKKNWDWLNLEHAAWYYVWLSSISETMKMCSQILNEH